jgi:transposase-like protein
MTTDDSIRNRAIKLLQNGRALPSEIAELAGISRQLLHYWIKTERIGWREARERYLKKVWSK